MSEGALNDVNITELTADVVKAFVANNAIPASELKTLVESVHATFSRLANIRPRSRRRRRWRPRR